ncbi:MAG: aldolase/citrate lyase family protein [Candidatus Gastranaerophilales bacterium]|nr:aldolase/citrate lyase family protein [Candidatus Gastranaerophilales bacterium]
MSSLEKDMLEKLLILKNDFHVTGIKAEFETEYITLKEEFKLKEIVEKAGLEFSVKIGGSSSLKDLYEVKTLGANNIIAPMVESVYALKKFTDNIKIVFSELERKRIKFFINIETISGINSLNEMLKSEYSKHINGLILGRTDMVLSLGLDKTAVNDDKILDYALAIADLAKKYNKEFIIGGGICPLSLAFFNKLPENSLSKFETRNVVFDAQKVLNDKNADIGILRALQFELLWIVYKRYDLGIFSVADDKRAKIIEERIKNIAKIPGAI